VDILLDSSRWVASGVAWRGCSSTVFEATIGNPGLVTAHQVAWAAKSTTAVRRVHQQTTAAEGSL
jgi:hypothetical protein